MDVRQSLIQLKRLMMVKRGEANCIDQQEINRLEQNIQPLYAHFVLDFRAIAKNRGLTDEEFDDVYQQTFLRIVQYIHTYDERRGSSGWIARIFHHCLDDFLRSQRRQHDNERENRDNDDPLTTPLEDIENIIVEQEQQARRQQALDQTKKETSEEDLKVLRDGPGRGPGRNAWHQAVQRFCERFWQHFGPEESDTELTHGK